MSGRPVTGNRKQAISVTLNQNDVVLYRVLGAENISEGIAEVTRRYRAMEKQYKEMVAKAAARPIVQEATAAKAEKDDDIFN